MVAALALLALGAAEVVGGAGDTVVARHEIAAAAGRLERLVALAAGAERQRPAAGRAASRCAASRSSGRAAASSTASTSTSRPGSASR